MAIDVAVYVLHVTTVVVGVLSFFGAILLMIGNGSLEKINAFLNKLAFSVGPSLKKGDESIVNIDDWIIKKSRLLGVIALIISILLVVNVYTNVI